MTNEEWENKYPFLCGMTVTVASFVTLAFFIVWAVALTNHIPHHYAPDLFILRGIYYASVVVLPMFFLFVIPFTFVNAVRLLTGLVEKAINQ